MKKRSQQQKKSFSWVRALRTVSLLAVSAFALQACEKEKSIDHSHGADVKLLNPTNGVAVNVDENLRVDYQGFASPASVDIYINDVQCTAEIAHPNADDTESDELEHLSTNKFCTLIHRSNYSMATAKLMSLNSVLLPGENTVRVVRHRDRQERKLKFHFDVNSPKLSITSIKLKDEGRVSVNDCAQENSQADDDVACYLQAGDAVEIKGEIQDASAIRWQDRKFYLRTDDGALTQVCNNTLKDNYCVPDNPNSPCNQECVGSFDYFADTNSFTISGVQWPNAKLAKPHFRYEIRDVNHQVTKEDFIVSGTRLDNSYALQINDRALGMLASVGQYYVDILFNDLWRVKLPSAAGKYAGDTIEDISIKFVEVSAKDLGVLCPILFGDGKQCAVKVTDLVINKPRFVVNGINAKRYTIRTGAHFNSVTVSFKLTPVGESGERYYSGRLDLNDFSLLVDFATYKAGEKGCDSDLICLKRQPAQLVLHPSILGNKQIFLRNSKCVGDRACSDRAGLLEIGFNSVTYLPKFVFWFKKPKAVKQEILNINNLIENSLENAISTFYCDRENGEVCDKNKHNFTGIDISRDSALANSFWDLLTISKLSSKKHNPFPFVNYIRDGFFGFYSQTDESKLKLVKDRNEQGEFLKVELPSLGTIYSGKNNYSAAKTGFPNRFAGVGDLDMAYAFSQDSVNQHLDMMFVKGEWNSYELKLDNFNLFDDSHPLFAGSKVSKDLCLKLTATKQAPRVEFTGYYHQLVGVDWELLGVTLVDTHKQDRPGSIKLILNDAAVSVYDCDDPSEANLVHEDLLLDISARVSLYSRAGMPYITPYERYYFNEAQGIDHRDIFARLNDDLPVVVRLSQSSQANDKLFSDTNAITRTIEWALNKHLQAFNRRGNVVTPFYLAKGEFGSNYFADDNEKFRGEDFEDFVTIRGLFERNPQLSKSLKEINEKGFFSPQSVWYKWLRFNVKYPTYGIDPSGGYFTNIIRVEKSSGTEFNGRDICLRENPSDIFRVLCLIQ